MSVIAVLLPGVKIYFAGELDSDMLMEIFVACFIFLCSYLLAKVLIRYSHDNLAALKDSNEEAMNNELAFLQAQIKPHFLYNAINTMVSFCYTDSEKAANLLVNFSKYLRLIFDIDHKLMIVPLAREIELIKAYVEIEKARFGELINVEYDIDPKFLRMEIPSFCIQPLVENAIKHGLCKKSTGGTVLISVKKREGVIIIGVCDTGIGMPAEKLDKLRNNESANDGVGFFNVSRRIRGWRDAQIDILSTEGEGTAVTIKISEGIA
ncbi:sensor histidine kinase [Anaerocolumna xylanovorans]|nr:histidine kinase [Anaerocolumna xylanovorans]